VPGQAGHGCLALPGQAIAARQAQAYQWPNGSTAVTAMAVKSRVR
jgi:hypothetical protein